MTRLFPPITFQSNCNVFKSDKQDNVPAFFVENLRNQAGKSAFKTKDIMLRISFVCNRRPPMDKQQRLKDWQDKTDQPNRAAVTRLGPFDNATGVRRCCVAVRRAIRAPWIARGGGA